MAEQDPHDKPGLPKTPISRGDLLRLGGSEVREAAARALGAAVAEVGGRLIPQVSRPPGAVGEIEFLLACTRCGACGDACPPHAIKVLDDSAGLAAGTPFLDVNRKPCVVCTRPHCMHACPTGALKVIPMRDVVMGTAVLDRDTCIAWLGGNCQRCFTACPIRDDVVVLDEQNRPYIDPRTCIGCGLCRAACPTSPRSITIEVEPIW
jgi:MauM/NapG family ferredoxin protein